MNINVFRNSQPTTELSLFPAIYTKRLMAEHRLEFTVKSGAPLDIEVDDYLLYKGEEMTVNKAPTVKRDHILEYNIVFEGVRHKLARFLIKDEGALVFDYIGNLNDYMFMFLESINGVDSGWSVGELEDVEPFALSFSSTNHWDALTMICEACACEWQMKNKVIIIKKTVGQARNYPMSYGKDNGLYSITRQTLEDSQIVTRAYASGGSQNLPQSYPYKVLTLTDYIDDPVAIDLYGIREGAISVTDVYPQRTATATAVGQINEAIFTLTDSTLDFDLSGQRIDGTEAYIVFKSGMLNGQQFKILSYNNSTKTIRYEANKDSNGNVLPSGVSVAEIGDCYTLIGIRMPQSYVDAALLALSDKRLEFLNSNKVPRVTYDAAIDPLDLKRNNVELEEGDVIPFTDTKIGLDANLRITSVSYTACYPILLQGMTFEIEVGQEVTYNRIQKIEKDIKETKYIVTQVTRESWENDRRNVLALNEFKSRVFDPDGNLDNALIQAIVALFGTDSQYYELSPNPTFTMGNNSFTMTATDLVHQRYEVTGLGYIWNLPNFAVADLDPHKSYYLSARCSRTSLVGEWVLTEDQRDIEYETGYWYFNFGILSSVIDGARSLRSTKAFTLISGGTIETSVITTDMIDTAKLFAQEIIATNITVTGSSRVAGFVITDDYLAAVPSGGSYAGKLVIKPRGIEWEAVFQEFIPGQPLPVIRVVSMDTSTDGAVLKFKRLNGHALKKALEFDMEADGTAINIISGKVVVDGSDGFTGTKGGIIFKNGICVG